MAPPAGQIRPWRSLAIFAGIVVILYSLVFFATGGDPTPKLGIDLQGGTRVTLTARTPNGAPPSKESLDQARQIIETRVNGIGVTGAEVVLDGNNLVITVPGANGDQAKTLGQTAKLYFRPVLGEVPATPQTAPGAPNQGGNGTQGGQAPSTSTPAAPTPVHQQSANTPKSPPSTQPAPPPSPAPGAGAASSDNTDPAEQIKQARALLQSTDPAVQQRALAGLDCAKANPLEGNDDPKLPLVACDQQKQAKYLLGPSIMSGERITNASAGPSKNGPGYEVDMNFDHQGEDIWASFTSANVGKQAAFVLDTAVVSAPQINTAILPGDQTSITGSFGQAEAQNLANVLQYGSLPLSFQSSESQTVSATLGLASLEAGLLAGAIGLAAVFVYCLFYYRALGVLTILSLLLSGVIVYAVLVLLGRWIGFTLDLAGVAGFIVAIGITADSFVIFFERIKDEMREGRTFRSAVPRAWVRARRTILSADGVSFLAAAVLYVLAAGQVQGFAFTLGMSTVLDLVVVFLVTHPLVALASQSRVLSQPSLSGLGAAQRVGAEHRSKLATAGKGA
ncbi:MAG TPA: protein translocase subunit SecD [Pseudonocardiaceae bacterium]